MTDTIAKGVGVSAEQSGPDSFTLDLPYAQMSTRQVFCQNVEVEIK